MTDNCFETVEQIIHSNPLEYQYLEHLVRIAKAKALVKLRSCEQ